MTVVTVAIPDVPPPLNVPQTLPGVLEQLTDPTPAAPHPVGPGDRNPISALAAEASMKSGAYKQAFDSARLLPKLPESFRIDRAGAGATTRQMFDLRRPHLWNMLDPRSGRVGIAVRQVLTSAPTTTIIDPTARIAGSAAARAGKTFTTFDALAYRVATIAGTAGAVLQLVSSVPNIIEAVHDEGVAGLGNTQSGRTGLAQAAGGGLAVYMLGHAAVKAYRGTELTPAVHHPGKLFLAATGSATLSKPWTAAVGFVSGAAVLANEAGFFDALNKHEWRGGGEIFHDAVEKSIDAIPFVGD